MIFVSFAKRMEHFYNIIFYNIVLYAIMWMGICVRCIYLCVWYNVIICPYKNRAFKIHLNISSEPPSHCIFQNFMENVCFFFQWMALYIYGHLVIWKIIKYWKIKIFQIVYRNSETADQKSGQIHLWVSWNTWFAIWRFLKV